MTGVMHVAAMVMAAVAVAVMAVMAVAVPLLLAATRYDKHGVVVCQHKGPIHLSALMPSELTDLDLDGWEDAGGVALPAADAGY